MCSTATRIRSTPTPTRIPVDHEAAEPAPDDAHPDDTHPDYVEYAEVEEADQYEAEEASDSGRHAAVNLEESQSMWRLDMGEIGAPRRRRAVEEPDEVPVVPDEDVTLEPAQDLQSDTHEDEGQARPAIHLPLADPYQAPEGYVIKANTHSGLYYTPDSELYEHTIPEVWFASEELAQANGFHKAE